MSIIAPEVSSSNLLKQPPEPIRPRIGITMGDPAGIGSEVILKAIASREVLEVCRPVIIGDAQHLAHTARTLGLVCGYDVVLNGEKIVEGTEYPIIYNLRNVSGSIELGTESAASGRAAAEYIETSVRLCSSGEIDAVCTAPINKRSLFLAGYNFPGHTEFYAHLTKTLEFAMAFVAGNLRIILLTTHVPLIDAIRMVERERLVRTVNLASRELKRWGINEPRIAMAALNPHGGEGGLFGIEEAAEILPAVRECRERHGIDISGPFSADTIFLRAARGDFDAVMALYHDQAMIPIKCMSFGEAVNVTMGLPFIRASVDHGTAFDIAGKGIAKPSSMIAAIKLAAHLARGSDGII